MDRSHLLKTLVIGAVALALFVPVAMIRDLVGERQARRNEAVLGIAKGWGTRQALVAQRRAELQMARQQLEDTTIRAPFNGVVQERRANLGEYLSASAPVVTLVRVDTATGLLAVEGRASRTEPFVAGTEPKRSAPPVEPEEEEDAETGQGRYVEVGGHPADHPAR